MNIFFPAQPTPTSKFLQGYIGAVTSAVSLAVSAFVIQHEQPLFFQLHFIFNVTFSEKGAEVVHLKYCLSFVGLHTEKMKAFSIIECALLLGWAESAHSEGKQAESCHQNDNTEIRPFPSCRWVFKGVSVLVLSLVNIYDLAKKGPCTPRVSLKMQR